MEKICLRKNNSSLIDSHPIPIIKEDNKIKNKNHQIHEISNYKVKNTKRKIIIQKNEIKNNLSPINDIKSVSKNYSIKLLPLIKIQAVKVII